MKKTGQYFSDFMKWLYPNLGVKRYFFVAVIGLFLVSAGLAVISYGEALGYLEAQFREIIYTLTGKTPKSVVPAGVVIFVIGLLAIYTGLKNMLRSVISVLLPDNEDKILDVVYSRRHLKRGPRIVVIGGGTGLSALLNGLKEYTCNLTAIVTVADDGGSSGKLRRELGVLPPGDIRNCLEALAEKEDIMKDLFSYRFESGTLAGHSLGNLLLVGLADRFGDFQKGIEQVGKVFALRGAVFPSTLSQVTLEASFVDGRSVKGESSIRDTPGKIKKLWLNPGNCTSPAVALEAIMKADMIVLGPGSLYTSVLPNLLVKDIRNAITLSKAPCVYVCNIMTEPGETDHYSVSDHLKVIVRHCGKGIVDAVLAAKEEFPQDVLGRYAQEGGEPVTGDEDKVRKMGIQYFAGSFYAGGDVIRHASKTLAKEILLVLFRLKPVNERVALVDSFLLNRKMKNL
ncbi:Uncharacterized protein family UPF0052 [Syntrophobotulus glycolicus DSM 8271]|uniref:Putative gluconeogenesis factor n=1 Tax=Syntrophobotulus glycolicus (strain DSM 8271 / FlGlyR) TaxID=645991 RepID=F0T1Q7_SYNGF|nr:gluconeogenesis factor YvcK family protein [Syntrophobotulus glycolicus]ADY57481.1 Uncharacterized protein family UPF0052 [Syntrophobotulus glycolicus DSM 8271]